MATVKPPECKEPIISKCCSKMHNEIARLSLLIDQLSDRLERVCIRTELPSGKGKESVPTEVLPPLGLELFAFTDRIAREGDKIQKILNDLEV